MLIQDIPIVYKLRGLRRKQSHLLRKRSQTNLLKQEIFTSTFLSRRNSPSIKQNIWAMQIKAFFAGLSSSSKRRNAAQGNAAASCVLDDCASLRQKISPSPRTNKGQIIPEVSEEILVDASSELLHSDVRLGKSLLRRFVKSVASRANRILRREKSLLSCVIPQRSMEMDTPAQPDIPEVEIVLKELSPSCDSNTERGNTGKERDLECDSTEKNLSERVSEMLVTARQEKKPYRYYHRLPCEEEKPSVADGTVSRLSLLFEDSSPEVSSAEEFITRTLSALGCDVVEGFAGNKGEARDGTFDHSPAHDSETSQGDRREMLDETGDSVCKEQEAQRPGDVEKEGYTNTLKDSAVVLHKILQKPSSFDMSCGNGIYSPTSSVDSQDTSINTPPENDVMAGVEKKLAEDHQSKAKSATRSPRVVTFHESVELAEKAKNDKRKDDSDGEDGEACDDDDDDMMYRQASFRSDEDYCTPILEFQLKDIGCGLQ